MGDKEGMDAAMQAQSIVITLWTEYVGIVAAALARLPLIARYLAPFEYSHPENRKQRHSARRAYLRRIAS